MEGGRGRGVNGVLHDASSECNDIDLTCLAADDRTLQGNLLSIYSQTLSLS